MKHVIVLDNISDEGLQMLEQADGLTYEVRTGLSGIELREALAEADGAVCRSGVKITAESLEGNKRLSAIVRAGVGTDNIDREAATRNGIIVMNTPTGNTTSTAEHTMALMLALSRNIPQAQISLNEGNWDRKKLTGSQLAGKTLGVVGLGRIGQSVAKRAKAFEMKVIGYDPYLSNQQAEQLGIEPVASVKAMLPVVDYLTVHVPKTPETANLISDAEIEMMKPTARLINCARGGIYDEAALVKGLEQGKIAGVALDVYENEPCTSSPLFGMPNAVCTPHLGASTAEAQKQVALEAVTLLVDFLTTGNVRHSVNSIPLEPSTLEKLGGFMNVGYRLGNLLAQWHGGAIEKCQIEFKGAVGDEDTRVVQSAVCAGLVDHFVVDEVNLVNANFMCQDRGIAIESVSKSAGSTSFQSSITVRVSGDDVECSASGTIFGSEMPRLVRMNRYRLESFMDGYLLILKHQDMPGLIGKMGQLLGDLDVNIAQMAVGRNRRHIGSPAIGVLNLDSAASDELIADIEKIDGIQSVRLVHLPDSDWVPPWMGGSKPLESEEPVSV